MVFANATKPKSVPAMDVECGGMFESELRLQDGNVPKTESLHSSTKSDQSLLPKAPKMPYKRLPQNVESVERNQKFKSVLLQWCVIIGGLFLTFLIISIVYICIFGPKNSNDTTNISKIHKTRENVNPHATHNSDPEPSLTVLVNVSSSIHLRGITKDIETVVVYKLQSSVGKPNGIMKDPAVTTLELRGPIDLQWLKYLLDSFQALEYLYVDVDEVCSEFSSGTSVEGVIRLDKLTALTAVNSKSCGILQWGGLTYNFPHLKEIKVRRATLSIDPPHFETLTKLFNQTRLSLEGLEVTESYICDDCDLTEVEFPRLRWLKIMRRRVDNPFDVNDTAGEEFELMPDAGKKSALQVAEVEDSNESFWEYNEDSY